MRRVLEPRAPEGRWQEIPVPRDSLSCTSSMAGGTGPRKGSLSPHDPPAPPIAGLFSGPPYPMCWATLRALSPWLFVMSPVPWCSGTIAAGPSAVPPCPPRSEALDECLEGGKARAARLMAAHLCKGQQQHPFQ